jgi:hypothetical protein
VAEELGEFAVDAHWTLALDGCARHEAVGAARLRECAARLLVPARRTLGWSLPAAEQPRTRKRRGRA